MSSIESLTEYLKKLDSKKENPFTFRLSSCFLSGSNCSCCGAYKNGRCTYHDNDKSEIVLTKAIEILGLENVLSVCRL